MPLKELIQDEIARRGRVPFREFMELALYHPEHGYYTSGGTAIGREGDFFTNVSVGALFGRLLARQFAELWERLGCPERFTIVEQGAHGADFAFDVLSHLQLHCPHLHSGLDYVIIEPSPVARHRQREKLGSFADRTRWAPSLENLEPFVGIHFSNELPDAFPVHLVKWTGERWVERSVQQDDQSRFVFTDGELSAPALGVHLARLPAVPPGYVTEVNLAALDWIAALAAKVQRGCVLAIDYGFSREEYYRPERTEGTLAAYAAHRREPNPLARPGEIDLTAHVDFTSLAEAALDRGLAIAGFTDQHHFIVGLSRLHFTDAAPLTAEAQKELRALQTLMHPTLMGRSFKALCLSKGLSAAPPLAGFHFASDPRAALGLA